MPKRVNGQPLRERRRKKTYTATMVKKVIADLCSGKTYTDVDRNPHRPCSATLYNWRRDHPEFAEAADAARAFGAEFCADRALDVAEQATEETVRTAKLKVDTLMHRAAMLAPQRWSPRGVAAAARPEPVEVVFRFRHFENVIGPDGRTVVREIKPEGEA